jgi:hypothetical protein
MSITTINIGSAPNDNTGDTIRDAYDICNNNFQDLDTTKFDIPAGTITQYVRGDGTLATLPLVGTSDKLITEVSNQTGGTLLRGTIVYINGSHGNLPTVTPSQANNDTNSAQTLGLVQDDIANNGTGFVVVAGKIGNLDTSALTAGVQLYLSPTTAGAYTITKQFAPNHLVYVGVCVRSHPTQGTIEVKIQNGYELDELHDVSAQTPVNRDLLAYNSTTQLWQNTSFYDYSIRGVQYFTDFQTNGNSTPYLQPLTSGAGASTARISTAIPNATINQIGFANYQTGTTATGYANHISDTQVGGQFIIGGGNWLFESYIEVETLSNTTDRFRFISGFGNATTNANDTNGVFFTYDEGGTANGTSASANWQCITSTNSVRTLTTTSVAVTTNFVKLRIVINAAGTSASFYINGTLVAFHTTNIPIWISFSNPRPLCIKQSIVKTIGTTSRNVWCDYLFYENQLTTLR